MRSSKLVFIMTCMLLCISLSQAVTLDFKTLEQYSSSDFGNTEEEIEVGSPTVPMSEYLFYENIGQSSSGEILFYGSLPGGSILFERNRVTFSLNRVAEDVSLTFRDATEVVPVGVYESKHLTHYFLGERGTFKNVHSYQSILYQDIWSGIDLCFNVCQKGVKYEFHVAPGADPSNIIMTYSGVERIIADENILEIVLGETSLLDEGLTVLQDGERIDAAFRLHDSSSYGYSIYAYDVNKPLIIDPLLYSTYVGGSSSDEGYSIDIDAQGCVYVVGETLSSNFPTVNGYDETTNGGLDCFVLKLNSAGTEIVYATYIGGLLDDQAYSISVDSLGCAYVTGETISTDFPTVNAIDDSYHENGDAFVFKLGPEGNELIYSTYYGEWSDDTGEGIEVDSLGNAYVLLKTGSWDLPAVSAYDSTHHTNWDAYLFKLNSTGTGLIYATYVGGSSGDEPYDLAIDQEGNAYVCGRTMVGWDPFPTVNAYDDTENGDFDVFVFKLNSTGNGLIYSTLVGGNNRDGVRGIDIDGEGNAYVTGTTWSLNFPQISSLYEPDPGALYIHCTYVFKLNRTGNGLLYSNLVGWSQGLQEFEGNPIAVDGYGHAFIVMTSNHPDFPTENAILTSNPGGYSTVVFQLNEAGDGLYYSTWLGGSDYDYGRGIVLDSSGTAFVTGTTRSSNFTLENALYESLNGFSDCFVAKITDLGDMEGPHISWSQQPETPDSNQEVTIIAHASDRNGVTEVNLKWKIDAGISWNDITMVSGESGWTASIPAQPADTEVVYGISAGDSRGNWASSPESSYVVVAATPQFNYELLAVIALVTIAAVSVIVIHRKRGP